MAEIIILCVFGLIVTEVYARTRRPKLYAVLNSALGIGGMLLWQGITTGGFNVTAYNTAFSAILGIPGAFLLYIFNAGGF